MPLKTQGRGRSLKSSGFHDYSLNENEVTFLLRTLLTFLPGRANPSLQWLLGCSTMGFSIVYPTHLPKNCPAPHPDPTLGLVPQLLWAQPGSWHRASAPHSSGAGETDKMLVHRMISICVVNQSTFSQVTASIWREMSALLIQANGMGTTYQSLCTLNFLILLNSRILRG